MTENELVLWAGLALGFIFGATTQITDFCLYRGLHDFWSERQSYKLQAFALALAIALAGTQLISYLGLVNINQSLYLTSSISWLLLPLGGVMFGYGMSLANGCGARALILVAQGNLRSLVVLLCLGVAAYMTLTGILAPIRISLSQLTTFSLKSPTLADGYPRTVIVCGLAITLTAFAFKTSGLGSRTKDLAGGAIIGLLIIGGWLTTGWLGNDPFNPTPITSFSFVSPVGDALQYVMLSTGLNLRFTITLVLGVLAGSLVTTILRGSYRLQSFTSAPEMGRYMAGGLLMGVGGVLALGCTVGQGLTGLSTLAYSSIIAIVSITFGARLHITRPSN